MRTSKKIKLLLLFTLIANILLAQNIEIKGVTVTGGKGIRKSLADVIAYEAAHPKPPNYRVILRPELHKPPPTAQDAQAKAVSRSGILIDAAKLNAATYFTPATQTIHSNFLSIWGAWNPATGRESIYVPPDDMGDVGTTQIMATANVRMKVFNKVPVTAGALTTPLGSSTTTLSSVLSVDLNVFFSDTALKITSISDPHVRFDRLTQRWFIVAIEVDHLQNNYCCIGVSDGPTLSSSSNFTLYYFRVSSTGGLSTDFFDYPTLGIDKNSLYIGGNMFFKGNSPFTGCNMWVVNKADLIAGTLTVTGFPHNVTGTDIYTPQGVHNDDPAATEGYFIGASQTLYGKIVMKRVSYSGSTPTLSADIPLTTQMTYDPLFTPSQGGVALDGDDVRFLGAMIKKNKITNISTLWTAQGSRMDSLGVGGFTDTNNRNGVIWYEIGNLATTHDILQSASLYDTSGTGTSIVHYIYPSIAMNGQGHNFMGFTSVGASKHAQGGVAGRYSTDAPGSFGVPFDITTTASTYNPGSNRWGDFTQTVVDPLDDMTMWTFTQYAPTTNAWGVRAVQLKMAPPPTPILLTTPTCGTATVTIKGISIDHSEFFDPGNDVGGPGFNRLQLSITGPSALTVSSVAFTNPTQFTASVAMPSTANAGTYNVVVTNPDGQTSSTSFIYKGGCPVEVCASASITSNLTGTNYQWQLSTDSVHFNNISNGGVYSGATTNTLQITNPASSMYGSQYRAVVDASNSNTRTLRFSNYWTGASSSAWENVANWSCGKIPDANTDVIINSGIVTVGSNQTIRSLFLAPSVNLTVNPGFKLTASH
jgi:hypothetical protein